jgi:hypothetical protein
VLDPLVCGPHGCGVQSRAPNASMPCHPGKLGVLQDANVLRHSRQGHVEPRGELADGSLAAGQAREDLTPGGIRERGEGGVEVPVMINHVV